jgi:hypothetical protein
MPKLSKPLECICDSCGARAMGRVFMEGIALSPPAGWLVHGKAVLDSQLGPVEQWLYCSEACAASIDDATRALAELATAGPSH